MMELSADQIDSLTEIVNIGVGRAADSLSRIVGARIELTVSSIHVGELSELSALFDDLQGSPDTTIIQDFEGDVSGRALLAFPAASGVTLAQIISGVDQTIDELDVDLGGILEEIGNIVLNAVLGSIGNMTQTGMVYSVPEFYPSTPPLRLIQNGRRKVQDDCDYLLLADVQFRTSQRDVTSSLLIAFDTGAIELILCTLQPEGAAS
ncbi:MAG: chemotaxis protein CheC [Planctomycetaceae bacterium]